MEYDLIIIGGGPAGLTAALYAARYKINTLLITKEIGGYAATAHKVCNFPSYPEITGFELMKNMVDHVKEFNIEIINTEVKSVTKDDLFTIEADKTYKAKKVIYAAGTTRRKLDIPGEEEFHGKGVSYCATCDGGFFKDKTVAVVGGSDAALTAALLLAEFATKVYIVYRKDKFFRAEPAWIELIEKSEKIECIFNEEVLEIQGNNTVENLKLKSGEDLKVDGIFIEIGSMPDLTPVKSLNIENRKGYITTDTHQHTNVKGFYAAGDITEIHLKQIITAAAQGAVAAYSVYNELKLE